MPAFDLSLLSARFTEHFTQCFGADARLVALEPMLDGHAGLTFGARIVDALGVCSDCILKLGPPGVKRSGSTDVYRQAALLQALGDTDVQVPKLLWASSDEEMLGAPFILMERLPGRTLIIWEPHASFSRNAADLSSLWRQTAEALAGLHAIDWRSKLGAWEAPTALDRELHRWSALLKHGESPELRDAGLQLGELLRSSMPNAGTIGLVHGDFQPGNILFDDGRVTGIIDWDLASIGPQGFDVGWLMMMADDQAWAEGWKPVSPLGSAGVVEAYVRAGGPATSHLAWFQAFAQLRMGAISFLNLKLHRSGRRVDPIWERFAPSIATLFSHGVAMLQNEGAVAT